MALVSAYENLLQYIILHCNVRFAKTFYFVKKTKTKTDIETKTSLIALQTNLVVLRRCSTDPEQMSDGRYHIGLPFYP